MKQTKRLMVTLLALLLVATFALCACTPKCDHVFEDGVCTLCGETEYVNVTIVLANGHDDANKQVYNVNTADYNVGTSKSVCDLLVAIAESEGEKQLFTCVTEGTALKQLGNLVGDTVTWNPYIAVFTTVDADKDLSAWGSTSTVLDTTVYSSAFGVKEMHLAEGAILYFVLVEASW
jgi:hypothetical protein